MTEPRKRPRYTQEYRDRHGKRRIMFRKRGCRQVTLPGRLGDPEFDAAYAVALAASEQNKPKKRGGEGSFDELIEIYLASPELKEKSQLLSKPIDISSRGLLKNMPAPR
jgi:enterobacteria phage integrase